MGEYNKLDPFTVPLMIDCPVIYAMMKETPSDGSNNQALFFEPPARLSPEQSLCAAMLVQAYEDFTASLVRQCDYNSANDWIFFSDPDYSYSFDYVCEALKLSPNYMRKMLKDREPQTRTFKLRTYITPNKPAGGTLRLSVELRERILALIATDMPQQAMAKELHVAVETIRKVGIEEMGEDRWRQRAIRILSETQKRLYKEAREARSLANA